MAIKYYIIQLVIKFINILLRLLIKFIYYLIFINFIFDIIIFIYLLIKN